MNRFGRWSKLLFVAWAWAVLTSPNPFPYYPGAEGLPTVNFLVYTLPPAVFAALIAVFVTRREQVEGFYPGHAGVLAAMTVISSLNAGAAYGENPGGTNIYAALAIVLGLGFLVVRLREPRVD